MKRTIKFRIWNNKTKQWIHAPHERPDLDGVNLFGENILFGNLLDGVGIEDLNEVEALQFTGSEDKNGREIFEGDILSGIYSEQGKNENRLIYGQVQDCRAAFEIYFPKLAERKLLNKMNGNSDILWHIDGNGHWGNSRGWYYEIRNLTVVGNIYENPELLVDKG